MSQVQEVKEASDIVEVIGSRVSLQRAGRYFKANCPFHSERSPSFFVDDALQRYKCFGCGESGDVINFLEKYEGMSFAEALEELAQKAGIELQKYTKSKDDTLREQILEVLSLARQYYHYLLTEHKSGDVARAYLKDRKVSKESVKLFQMGYALESWDGLIKFLHKKKKYSLKLLEDAGLIIKGRGGKYYDRFRGRIIFPLKDHRGRVVGFSGRKIAGDEKDAKYINSPETLLYHKSKMLFGFSELYQEIRKAGYVVVVEGEFDVVSSTQAHMNAIVAIKGSALTEDHAKLLQRTVDKVLLSLDTDSAGVAATKKAITALGQTELELRVIVIPDGKDPDELIKTDPKLWRQAVKSSVSAHEFLISAAFKQHDATRPEGKRAIMKELLPTFAEIKHAVELEHYSRILAEKLGVKLESVREDIKNYEKTGRVAESKPRSETQTQDAQKKKSAREKLEEYVLFLLFQSETTSIFQLLRDLQSAQIEFLTPGAQQIIRKLDEHSGAFELKSFASQLPADLQEVLFEIHSNQDFISAIQNIDVHAEWKGSVSKLKSSALADTKKQIIQKIAALDEKESLTPEEEREHNELLRNLAELNAQEKLQ